MNDYTFYFTCKQEKMLHCLLWNLGHQNVLSPGHEKIRTFLCKLCPKTNFLFVQNDFIFILFKLSSFRQKDVFIMHVHSKYEQFDLDGIKLLNPLF